MIVMGIDPSLRGCAVAFSLPTGVMFRRWSTEAEGTEVHQRFKRYGPLLAQAVGLANHHRPRLIVIEGYAYAAGGGGSHWLVEFGALLRDALIKDCHSLIEVTPQQVKIFAAGSGRACKQEVRDALQDTYHQRFNTFDEADAFACLQLGRCLLDELEPKHWQHAALASVRGQPVVKSKKRPARKQGELIT